MVLQSCLSPLAGNILKHLQVLQVFFTGSGGINEDFATLCHRVSILISGSLFG